VRGRQNGITLVMSLIMLMVLTLLVVSAVRFGNINLKISGNAQTETEASAATQVGIEQTLNLVVAAPKIDLIPAQALTISTGGANYAVNVAKPTCVLTRNMPNTELDASNAGDRLCFGNPDPDKLFDSHGKLLDGPSACKSQQWDVAATTSDVTTGAQVAMLQGVSVRVDAAVQCPP
jgi:PilX N-terminal